MPDNAHMNYINKANEFMSQEYITAMAMSHYRNARSLEANAILDFLDQYPHCFTHYPKDTHKEQVEHCINHRFFMLVFNLHTIEILRVYVQYAYHPPANSVVSLEYADPDLFDKILKALDNNEPDKDAVIGVDSSDGTRDGTFVVYWDGKQ